MSHDLRKVHSDGVELGSVVCYVLEHGPRAGEHRDATIERLHKGGARDPEWAERNGQADITVAQERLDDLDSPNVVAAYKDDQGWGSWHFHEECGRPVPTPV